MSNKSNNIRRDKNVGDNSHGNDDNIGTSPGKVDKGIYRYCINCWGSTPKVEFYEEVKGYEWQYCQRCKLCERKYQQDFMEKYPNTKRRRKLAFLTEDELEYYDKMIAERRKFNDT